MRIIGIVVVYCISFFRCQGQITFERNDSLEGGGGMFCCPTSTYIIQTHDRGYLTAGYIVSGTNANYFWEKLDSTGHAQWWHMFGYWADVFVHSVDETFDNGFIICGNPTASWFQTGIVKTDSNGINEWQKFIGIANGDLYGNSAKQTMDGGYIIAGSKYFPGTSDAELIKLDSSGNIIWSKAYGATLYQERFYDIVETADSGFVVIGSTSTPNLDLIFIVRTNSAGDTIWTRRFQDAFDYTEALSVIKTFDNGFVISGFAQNTWLPGNGSILFKLDSLGNFLWEKKIGVGDSLLINAVKETSDSGLILIGNLLGNQSGGCLIKTNSQGDTLWTRLLDCAGAYVCETYDNGFAVAGGGLSTVVKTDELGYTQCRSIFAEVGIHPSSLTQVFDTVNVINDTLILIPLGYGNNGTPLIERMLCNSLSTYESTKIEPSILIFPNPSEKILNVQCESEITSLEIYNSMGVRLKQIEIDNKKEVTVDIHNLPPSIYIIKFHCKEGATSLNFLKE
jgi:hypothetical protein